MKANITKTKRPILKNLGNLHKDPAITIFSNGNDSDERVQDMDLDPEDKNQKTIIDSPLVHSEDNSNSQIAMEATLESLLIQEDHTTGPQSPVVNEEQEAVNSESQNTTLSKTPIVPLEKENANEREPTLQSGDSDVITMYSSLLDWEITEEPDSPLSSIDYDLLQLPNLLNTDQFGMGTDSDNNWSFLTKESLEGLKGGEYEELINFDDYSAQVINTDKLVIPMQMVSISYAEVLPDDNDPNYYCRVCKMTSDSRSSFYAHLTNHHKMVLKPLLWWRITDLEVLPDEYDPNFYCKLCQKKYKSVYAFRTHIKNIHKKQRKQSLITTEDSGFSYTICNQVLKSQFSQQRHLYRHYRTVQPNQVPNVNDPNYYCSVCDRTSSNKTAFRVHLRHAHQTFANPDVLPDKHDPYNNCATCDITFKQKQGFLRGLRRYHGTSMATSEPSPAALLPDENDPDNNCCVCDHKFSSRQSFRNHIKTKHGKEKEARATPNLNKNSAPGEPSLNNELPNQEIVGSKSKSTSVKSKANGTRTRNTRSNTTLSTLELKVRRCGACDREFDNKRGLCIHLILAHKVQCRVSTCMEVNAKLAKSSTTSVASQSLNLRCGGCDRQFGTKRALCLHLIQTHEVQCNFSTCVQASAEVAKSIEAESTPTIPIITSDSTIPIFHCGICNKELASERGLCLHLIQTHKVRCRVSTCVEVNASLASSSTEETNLLPPSSNNTEEPEDVLKYHCSACNKEFATVRGLCTHLNLAHYVKCTLSACAEVGANLAKSLEEEEDLPPTTSTDDSSSPSFPCGTCNREFGSERGLCMHLVKAHERQFTGSNGGETSKNTEKGSTFKPVVTSESAVSSFICRLCDRECVKERGLCMHLSLMHNVRSTRLTCVEVNSKLVKSHEVDLSPTAPSKTNVASSKTDEPNFYCGSCKRTFATDRGLCTHLILTHKVQCTLSTCVKASANLEKSLESDLPPTTTPVDIVDSISDSATKYICRLCDRNCAKKRGLCVHLSLIHKIRSTRLTCVEVNSKLVKPPTEESDMSSSPAPDNTSIFTPESDNNSSPSIHHCRTCNRRFPSEVGLCMHLIKIHKLQPKKPGSVDSAKSPPKSNLPPASSNSNTSAYARLELKCSACNKKFGSRFGLHMHFRLAHKKRNFKSKKKISKSTFIVDTETSKKSSKTTTVQLDLLPDKDDPNNYCKVCNKTLSNATNFRLHLFSQHQVIAEPSYQRYKTNGDVIPDLYDPNNYCNACDKTYTSKPSFRNHLERHHRLLCKNYTATVAAAAAQRSEVQNMIPTNVSNDMTVSNPDFYCKECDFFYSTVRSYETHYYRYHHNKGKDNTRKRTRSSLTLGTPVGSGSTNVDDNSAKRKKRNASDATKKRPTYKEGRGIKWVDPTVRPDIDDPNFHCKSCQITLETKAAYRNHLTVIHRIYVVPEETFYCESCKKSYRTKEHFSNHLSHLHTSTPCKKITTTFTKRKAPATPTKKIAVPPKKKEEPEAGNYTVQHVCDVCQEAQRTKGGLRNHRQVIHGISVEFDVQQKYCNLCQSRYADMKGYRIHLLDMHGLKSPTNSSTPIADSHFCKHCNIAYRSAVHYQLHCFKHHGLEL